MQNSNNVTIAPKSRYFALVPAAGIGARMAEGLDSAVPKQYLPLAGSPMIHHALRTLCASPQIERVFVVLSPQDTQWAQHAHGFSNNKLAMLYCGGTTRAESVHNGLNALAIFTAEHDWVLVHDAARPCLSLAHLDNLIEEVGNDPVGGILAVPVADTLKRAGADGRIEATVPREHLWQAQTPQMFRYGLLREALTSTHILSGLITDEASAIEAAGHHPKLIPSDSSNLKVTYPSDLELAARILQERGTI